MPEDAERKGLGTPATRAGILEKLVSAGFLERKKNKKTVQLLPSHDAVSLITVLPEQLQSPLPVSYTHLLSVTQTGQAVLTAPAPHFVVQLHTAGGSSLALPSSISAIRSASSTWFRK